MVFVGVGESSAEALFLQCPQLQWNCDVLTAESPHNAEVCRFFPLSFSYTGKMRGPAHCCSASDM